MRLSAASCVIIISGAIASRYCGAQITTTTAKAESLSIHASRPYACPTERQVIFTAREGGKAVDVDWKLQPAFAGTLSTVSGDSTTFSSVVDPAGSVAVTGHVRISAHHGKDSASIALPVSGKCRPSYDGDMSRVTIGYEQIGASGVESSQKYAFDLFISRPVPFPGSWPLDVLDARQFLGSPLKWWGEVRIGSYPQQVTSDAASFAAGFVTSAGQLKVNRLVQSAEFTTGPELRLLGSGDATRSIIGSSLERFALTTFFGLGAVGPFPLATDSLPVFFVPKAGTPQGIAFAQAESSVVSTPITTPYVAFRAKVPDRFLVNYTVGLRLYTYYADQNGEPLQTPPALVSIAWGRNDLITPYRPGKPGHAWHISAYYPFALGDRADPDALILYLFGDVWMTASRPQYTAPAYQLQLATDANNKAISAADTGVTIVTIADAPRDTYRLGISIDLLKVWQRLAGNSAAKDTTAQPAAPKSQ